MSKTAAEEDCTGTNCVLRREKSRASNNIYNPSRRTHNTTGWDYTKGYRLVIGDYESKFLQPFACHSTCNLI